MSWGKITAQSFHCRLCRYERLDAVEPCQTQDECDRSWEILEKLSGQPTPRRERY